MVSPELAIDSSKLAGMASTCLVRIPKHGYQTIRERPSEVLGGPVGLVIGVVQSVYGKHRRREGRLRVIPALPSLMPP